MFIVENGGIFLLRCIKCNYDLILNEKGYICQNCNFLYKKQNGIYLFHDTQSQEEKFFPEDAFSELFNSETNNFWFKVRNKIIKFFILKYVPNKKIKILDLGCGTGFVSQTIKSMGYSIDCLDIFHDALRFCMKRNAGDDYYLSNLYLMPFSEQYNLISAFDVIEHINDDCKVLNNIHSALKRDGQLLITVPANKKLWSYFDIHCEHKRRYSKEELAKKIEDTGFEIVRISYFMTLLFPFIYVSRLRYKNIKKSDKISNSFNELSINHFLNMIFYLIFNIESYLIKYINLPFGSSLICLARKRDE